MDNLLAKAVDALVIRAEEDWKRDNLQRLSREQRMQVTVALTSLSNWLIIRDRMSWVSPIITVEVTKLSIKEVVVNLKYMGSPDQLRLSMAQSDLNLKFSKELGGYVLKLVGP